MAAAENGALPGGKVGGIGDVVRDLPIALAERGWRPTVVVPESGLFRDLNGAALAGRVRVPFGGGTLSIDVLELPAEDSRVRHLALKHSQLGNEPATIYTDDGASRPFATDATKFALFSATVGAIAMESKPDVVHLHDWHAAMLCMLRQFDARFSALRGIRTVYTIHNLALQGIRPLDGDASSLAAWFPDSEIDRAAVADPRYADCVNPMAVGIRFSDKVNTVSPTYAKEITRADDPARGFRGGEGLEADLQSVSAAGRLVGILNGCEYPRRNRHRPGWRRLVETMRTQVAAWSKGADASMADAHETALERLAALPTKRPADLLTSIGRITDQKALLFLAPTATGETAIERILAEANGTFVLLGSGDPELQARFLNIAQRTENFVFLCGYSDALANLLYEAGDLFLMPSSFEPCGISQMLAMRASQPCVVHGVGGLKDTVLNDVNGFVFEGDSPREQANGFVNAVQHALAMKSGEASRWLRIRDRAAAARFSWPDAAGQYIDALYAQA